MTLDPGPFSEKPTLPRLFLGSAPADPRGSLSSLRLGVRGHQPPLSPLRELLGVVLDRASVSHHAEAQRREVTFERAPAQLRAPWHNVSGTLRGSSSLTCWWDLRPRAGSSGIRVKEALLANPSLCGCWWGPQPSSQLGPQAWRGRVQGHRVEVVGCAPTPARRHCQTAVLAPQRQPSPPWGAARRGSRSFQRPQAALNSHTGPHLNPRQRNQPVHRGYMFPGAVPSRLPPVPSVASVVPPAPPSHLRPHSLCPSPGPLSTCLQTCPLLWPSRVLRGGWEGPAHGHRWKTRD